MKKVLLGICITGLSATVMAQATETYKIWNDKEPDPAKYAPRRTTSNTTSWHETTSWHTTTTTTTRNNENAASPQPNNTQVVKCTKNGKTTYSNTEPC